METFRLHDSAVSIALFANVTNAPEIKTRLVTASTLPADEDGDAERARLNFTFVEASMLLSRLHLLTAISQALLAQADRKLRTKTIESEVLWELEPGSNITESLRHFGLSPATTSVVLVHFAPLDGRAEGDAVDEGTVYGRMKAAVNGELGSLDSLGTPAVGVNLKSLRKMYKLNQEPVLVGIKAGSDAESRVVDALATGTVALKVLA